MCGSGLKGSTVGIVGMGRIGEVNSRTITVYITILYVTLYITTFIILYVILYINNNL